MGHLLEYSGIVTKTRAMESRLLSPGQFQELASLHTIPEAVEYLKKNTAYAETLESLEPTQLHRGNIEKLLTQSLYRVIPSSTVSADKSSGSSWNCGSNPMRST